MFGKKAEVGWMSTIVWVGERVVILGVGIVGAYSAAWLIWG